MSSPQVIPYIDYIKTLVASHKSKQKRRYSLLIGAGFSKTAGIPLASEIVDLLAAFRLKIVDEDIDFLDYSSHIRRYLDGELSTKDVFHRLAESDNDYAGMEKTDAYSRLLADPLIFPDDRESRRDFLSSLLTESSRGSYGYNFESLFVAYYAFFSANSSKCIDTILTTNFDDVMPRAFDRLGLPCRIIDVPSAIVRESPDTTIPRILYLHGRHTHYDLLNTEHEQNTPGDQRSAAIYHSFSLAANAGGLLVAGHGGWDLCVMEAINTNLKMGLFGPGVYWCIRGTENDVPSAIREMTERFSQFKVIVNCSAMKIARALLISSGIDDSVVYRHCRSLAYGSTRDFDRRAIQVFHANQPGTSKLRGSDKRVGEALTAVNSSTRIELGFLSKTVKAAFRSGRMAGMALEFLEGLDSESGSPATKRRGDPFLWRARLRLQYTSNIHGVLSDVQQAESLGVNDMVEAKLIAFKGFIRLGLRDEAINALMVMKSIAKKRGSELDSGRYELCHAFIDYWSDKLDSASSRLQKASKSFSKIKAFEWLSEVKYLEGHVLLYANRADEAMGVGVGAKEDALRANSRNDEAAANFLMACVSSTRNDLGGIEVHLTRAEKLAEEGPSFSLLGNVHRLWSDYWVAQKDLKKALRSRDISNYFFSLAPYLPALAIGRVARNILRAQAQVPYTDDDFESFRVAVEEYGHYGDLSAVVVQWAEIALALMVGEMCEVSDWVRPEALKICTSLSNEFAIQARIDLASEEALDATSLDARLACHVAEWPVVVNLLELLCRSFVGSKEQKRMIKAHYFTLKGRLEAHGHATPCSEALVAVISSHIYRKKILPGVQLIHYDPTTGNSQFTKKSVQSFLLAGGFWEGESLL
jgi:tetratricopeptide (TPR) repeat protein